jgi:glycerol-3-phosphate dehydrogenase (NAD(P)+)
MNSESRNIAVLGGGSWGTAIVKMLTEQLRNNTGKINKLQWWLRKQETVDYVIANHHNPSYISSVEIHPELVEVTSDIKQVVNTADIMVLAVPSAFLKILKVNL